MATSRAHTVHSLLLKSIALHLERLANSLTEDTKRDIPPYLVRFLRDISNACLMFSHALEAQQPRCPEEPLLCPRCSKAPVMPSKYRTGCYYCESCARYYILTSATKDVLIPVEEEPGLPIILRPVEDP